MGIQFKSSHFDRFLLDTETDAGSPDSEELESQSRKNFEGLTLLAFCEGSTGTITTTPTSGLLIDANAGFTTGAHNYRTVLIVDGAAKGLFYTITKTSEATCIRTSSGDLAADGCSSGDKYKIFYDLKQNLDGHDHDNRNSNKGTLSLVDTGTYTGDGATSQGITGVGFLPKFVKIWTDLGTTEGYFNMHEKVDQAWGDYTFVHSLEDVTPSHRAFNERIKTLDDDGFTVSDDSSYAGGDNDPNMGGRVYDYLALG